MLEARKATVWKNRYVISEDGRPLTTWDGTSWKTGGTFELEARRFVVRGNMWGSTYEMCDQDGVSIASANSVGRKRWTVSSDGRTYSFQRGSVWRSEEELHADGRRVGSVRRPSIWRGDAVADLPGLPLPVAVFVLGVVLAMWDSAAVAAG